MSRQALTEFIKLYKNEPCLWQIKSSDYHNKDKKESAYNRLLKNLQITEPFATKDSVVKKINDLRSAYRKEEVKLSKILRTSLSLYKPTLWYYPLMSFLNNQNVPLALNLKVNNSPGNAQQSNMENTVEEISDDPTENFRNENLPTENLPTVNNNFQRARIEDPNVNNNLQRLHIEDPNVNYNIQGPRIENSQRDHFQIPHVKNHTSYYNSKRRRIEEDRFNVIGKSFSLKLRNLPTQQMLIAERLMNETLFQAEMGLLNLSHKIVCENEQNPQLHLNLDSNLPGDTF